MENKTNKETILGILSIFALATFYGFAISNKDDILIMISAVIAGILIVINICYIFKNIKYTGVMRGKVGKRNVNKINIHPLELFIIDKIWHHKKDLLAAGQIYAGVIYGVKNGDIIYTEKSFQISNQIDITRAEKYNRVVIEMAFLSSIEYKQTESMKSTRLNKFQSENRVFTIDEVKENIKENCKNRGIVYKLIGDVKEEFFVNVEGNFAAFLMLVTVLVAIMQLILGISFINEANVMNFYVPIGAAIVLIGTITNKFRERVIIQNNKVNDISVVLNYIRSLKKNEEDRIKQIHLYCLGKLNANHEIVSIFL